jgi:cytochrome b561
MSDNTTGAILWEAAMSTHDYTYPRYAKLLHAGLALFGIAAWLTGELAEEGSGSGGYLLHAWLGLTLGAMFLARLVPGFAGTGPLSFSGWSPLSRRQWSLALQDLRALLKLRLPDRERHEGLAGVTQLFGLLLFGWMAVTGTGLFFLGGGAESDLFESLEELHAVGESLIPLYLALHVGAVLLHSLAGDPVWRRMFGPDNRIT